MISSSISKCGSFVVALLLNLLLIINSEGSLNVTANSTKLADNGRQHWTGHYRRQAAWPQQSGNSPSSITTTKIPASTSTSAETSACEYKGLMTDLNDRVNMLATLDENLRTRLDNIEHKLGQFEGSNLANADNFNEKVHDLKRHLMRIELLQQKFEQESNRATRQATDLGPSSDTELSASEKLNAVATLLASSAANVKNLEHQLSANISRLLQDTNTLLARVERLRRAQQKSNRGNVITYPGTPHAPEETAVTSCNMGIPTTNGILKLKLPNFAPFYVLCEEDFDRGGWLVIQNRHFGDINFQRDWAEYKSGFGNLAGDFFIGLDKLHALTTNSLHELAIIMVDHANVTHKARYNLFAIGNEQEAYDLKLLGQYSGDAGDALSYHAGSKFSTFDNDNDGCVECNCAAAHLGGWWYNWCDMSNLNGKYYAKDYDKVPTYTGVYWQHFNGPNYSLRSARMMIRPLPNADDVRR